MVSTVNELMAEYIDLNNIETIINSENFDIIIENTAIQWLCNDSDIKIKYTISNEQMKKIIAKNIKNEIMQRKKIIQNDLLSKFNEERGWHIFSE